MGKVEVGQRIKMLRQKNGYTRESFARRVRVSSRFLYEVEAGKCSFSIDVLCRFASALSVSCDYILFGYEYDGLTTECKRIMNLLTKFDKKQLVKVLGILEDIYNLNVKGK